MNTKTEEALNLAKDLILGINRDGFYVSKRNALKAINEALAQPAQECQECENLKHDLEEYMDANKELINREWQGLSDDEINDIKTKAIIGANGMSVEQLLGLIVSLTEQELKEKNT